MNPEDACLEYWGPAEATTDGISFSCVPHALQDFGNDYPEVVSAKIQVRVGQHLFRTGDPFRFVYAIRNGWFKSQLTIRQGRNQVFGFSTKGDLLGMEGIDQSVHGCDAIAIDDSSVDAIDFSRFEEAARLQPHFHRHFHIRASLEIAHHLQIATLLRCGRAENRLAAFLMGFVVPQMRKVQSRNILELPMTREDIGNYLGLTNETVSRMLTRFERNGVVALRHRHITILKPDELRRLSPLGKH